MSLVRRYVKALAEAEIPFDAAETLLRRRLARTPSANTETPAERMYASRREWAEEHALAEGRVVAREHRLRRWLGLDLAAIPEDDESEE